MNYSVTHQHFLRIFGRRVGESKIRMIQAISRNRRMERMVLFFAQERYENPCRISRGK